MKKAWVFAAAGVVAVWSAAWAAELKSGPQVGDPVPGAFEPLNLTGPAAGEESCLFCRYGKDPVVMIFARSQSPELAKLTAQVEKAAAAHKSADMGACVIYLNADKGVQASAKKMAEDGKFKEVILACVNPKDIEDYKVAADADVTVLLYRNRTVRANHAFKKGELTEAAAQKVLADLPKILEK